MILRTLLLLAFAGTAALAKEAKPNVLFIVIDDMNDSISLLDPKSPIKTPNIERLAKRGMSFLPCLLHIRSLQSVARGHAYRLAPQHEWRLPKRQ